MARYDEAWLTDVLASPVTAVEREVIGEGAGAFGELHRLRVVHEDGTVRSYILKLGAPEGPNRDRALEFGLYAREHRFYADVAGRSPIRTPRCHWATFDEATGEVAFLLEDLGGLRMEDDLTGFGFEDARAVIRAAARLHAAWWEHPRLADMTWAPSLKDSTEPLVRAVTDAWPTFVERYGAELPSGGLDAAYLFVGEAPEVFATLSASPITVVHGDLRPDNVLFDPEPVFIDWQLVWLARGAFDVGYLLSQSLEIDVRRRNERDLVRAWHESLAEFGVTGYALNDAIEDYRVALRVCLVGAIVGSTLDRANERGVALHRAQVMRAVTAVVDWTT